MATAKKKPKPPQSILSKAGSAISGAVGAVVETAMNPPTALNKVPRKTAAKRKPVSMDRKLVSTMEDYEVKYLAQKHGVTQKAVKEAVGRVGHSRAKVERELKSAK